jgi:hypothetical protein
VCFFFFFFFFFSSAFLLPVVVYVVVSLSSLSREVFSLVWLFLEQNLLEKSFFIHQQSISAFVLSCDGTMIMTMTTTMK